MNMNLPRFRVAPEPGGVDGLGEDGQENDWWLSGTNASTSTIKRLPLPCASTPRWCSEGP